MAGSGDIENTSCVRYGMCYNDMVLVLDILWINRRFFHNSAVLFAGKYRKERS